MVEVRSDGHITAQKDISVAANRAPSGRGGIISIKSSTTGLATDTWDCKVPGDPCVKVAPQNVNLANCTASAIQINEDLLAHGYGTTGIGGYVLLEAPIVKMRQTGTAARKIQDNSTSTVDGVTTGTGGCVRVRARSSMFVAQTASGTVQHKVRAMPGGVGSIAGTLPLGGDFNPAHTFIAGLAYTGCLTP